MTNSRTHKYLTPEGAIYITVRRNPVWIGVSCGKHGTGAQVIADRLGAVCGMALRGGVPPRKLARALVDTVTERSPRERGQNGHSAYSIPDAIGLAICEEW